MTGEELQLLSKSMERLTEALAGNRELVGKIDNLVAQQAGVRATLTTLSDNSRVQVAALFDYRDKHEMRLATIERTYVERDTLKDSTEENKNEHMDFRTQIGSLRISMAKVGGAIAVGTAALNWVASNWGYLTKGHV